MSLFLLFFACSDSTKECPQCPKCPPDSSQAASNSSGTNTPKNASSSSKSGISLSPQEAELLQENIENLREGIHPLNNESVGICKGSGKMRKCEEFLGKDVSELPEGKYMLYAKLVAPKLPHKHDWNIELEYECTTTNPKSGKTTTRKNTKEHSIRHSTEGFRLSPLTGTITSPNKYGAKSCTWKLILHNADGPKEITGSWSVPGPS